MSSNVTGSWESAFGANKWMVEEMHEAWQADPGSVSPQWRALFEGGDPAATPRPRTGDDEVPALVRASAPDTAPEPASRPADGAGTVAPLPRTVRTTDPAVPGPGGRPGTVLRRGAGTVQDVTRSDLPPAPASDTAPPTSPYVRPLPGGRRLRRHQHPSQGGRRPHGGQYGVLPDDPDGDLGPGRACQGPH